MEGIFDQGVAQPAPLKPRINKESTDEVVDDPDESRHGPIPFQHAGVGSVEV